MIEQKIKERVRSVQDFPKKGVDFKDITTLFKDPDLYHEVVEAMIERVDHLEIDAIASIESRGFLFGFLLASRLNKPFIIIRKKGKLPADTVSQSYDLEYGTTTIEMHKDAITPGQKVLIHDDLLATGGTVLAAKELIKQLEGVVTGYAFVIELEYLGGRKRLTEPSVEVISLANYNN